MDDTNLKTDSEYNNETDSVNNTVNDKEPDDNIPLSKKNNWCIIAVIVIVIIIGGLSPLIIHIEAPNKKSEITADGLLGYIVSFISAAVTAVLALYAIYQTKQANEMTKRANKLAADTLDATKKATAATEQANKIAEQANKATEEANKRADELTLQANKIAEKALEIERINYQLQIRPLITITKYSIGLFSMKDILECDNKLFISIGDYGNIDEEDGTPNIEGIVLRITNTTESFITFQYDDGETDNPEFGLNYAVDGYKNLHNRRISLIAGESADIVLYSEDDLINDFEKYKIEKISLSFILENKLMHKYKEYFSIHFAWIGHDTNGKSECVLDFNDYRLYRFEYENGTPKEVKEEL